MDNPGQTNGKLVKVRWWDSVEYGGWHHIDEKFELSVAETVGHLIKVHDPSPASDEPFLEIAQSIGETGCKGAVLVIPQSSIIEILELSH